MANDFNWGRYSPEAKAAWDKFNQTGDRSEVFRIIAGQVRRIGDPRRLWAVYLMVLTQAQAD